MKKQVTKQEEEEIFDRIVDDLNRGIQEEAERQHLQEEEELRDMGSRANQREGRQEMEEDENDPPSPRIIAAERACWFLSQPGVIEAFGEPLNLSPPPVRRKSTALVYIRDLDKEEEQQNLLLFNPPKEKESATLQGFGSFPFQEHQRQQVKEHLLRNPHQSSPAVGTVILNSGNDIEPFRKKIKRDFSIFFSRHPESNPPPYDDTWLPAEGITIKVFSSRLLCSNADILATPLFLPHVDRFKTLSLADIHCEMCRQRMDLVFLHLHVFHPDGGFTSRFPLAFRLFQRPKLDAALWWEVEGTHLEIYATPCQDSSHHQ